MNGPVKALGEKVAAQDRDIQLSKQILGSIDEGNFGPGTEIDQYLSKALQTAGFTPGSKEADNYLRNLNINQARDILATSGMRAALGAQFTENENKAFKEILPSINSPKELIKSYYQLRIANAMVDQDRLDYILANRQDPVKADMDWRKSGAREKILREYAPIYSKIAAKADNMSKSAETPKQPATAQKTTPSDVIDFTQLLPRKRQ